MTITLEKERIILDNNGEPQKIDEEVYDIVKFFYPEKLPQVAMNFHHIMDIMDCSFEKASDLSNKVRDYYGREIGFFGIYMVDFCEYMQVDETLIQLFLASLRIPTKYNHLGIRLFPESYYTGPDQPMKLADFIEYLKHNDPPNLQIIKSRKKRWKELFPKGEMFLKPVDSRLRVIIHTKEAAQILGINLRTAQDMFKDIRETYGLPKHNYIPITRFALSVHLTDQEVREALAVIYGENDDR